VLPAAVVLGSGGGKARDSAALPGWAAHRKPGEHPNSHAKGTSRPRKCGRV